MSRRKQPPWLTSFAILGNVIQGAVFITLLDIYFKTSDQFLELSCFNAENQLACAELPGNMFTKLWLIGSFGVAGLTINLFAAAKYNYRAQWFFWISLLFAVLYLPVFPAGTILAGALIGNLIIKRREFFEDNKRQLLK